MEKSIFLMFFILISVSAFMMPESVDNVRSLTSCVLKIVKQIDYKKYSNFMDVTVMNMNNDLEMSTLHQLKGLRFVSRKFLWNTENISNIFYILMSEDYEELERGLRKVTSDIFWNPSARFIIVMKTFGNYSLRDVTDLLHTYNILYKVSLISRDGDDYAIYKYNLITPGYCIKSSHLTFWSWCSQNRDENKTFLNYGSIRNCRFKFISHNLWPFMNFDSKIQGVEQYMLSVFQKQYGVNIELMEYVKQDKYGNILNNLSSIMLNKVRRNEVEGAVGGYSIKAEYYGNNSHTYPMTIDHMLYILAHTDYIGQWAAVSSQSLTAWVVIGILFIIFSVAAIVLSIFPTPTKDISHNVLVVFGYLLNKNFVKKTHRGLPQTLVLMSLLFFAFIIPYTIQASLFSVTTQPIRAYEPKEPEDLHNLQAILYSSWPNNNEIKISSYCGSRINCLLKVKNHPEKSLYTVVSNAHYQVYKWQLTNEQCDMAMYHLREPYITIFRTIYLRRGSALLQPLNKFIIQIGTAGILRWYALRLYFREWLRCKSHYRSQHTPLTLEHFHNIFLILIVGYCFSTIIFIYEVKFGPKSSCNVVTNIEEIP